LGVLVLKLLGKRVAVGRCGEHTISKREAVGVAPGRERRKGFWMGISKNREQAARPGRGMLSKAI